MSRRRRWALILSLAVLLSVAAVLGAVYSPHFVSWLVPRALPETARVKSVHGSLASGLRIEGFSMPGIEIDELSLAAVVRVGELRTPTLSRLEATGIRIDPAAFSTDETVSGDPPALVWPKALPRFFVGPVQLKSIDIAGATPVRIDHAGWTSVRSVGSRLEIDGLDVQGPELSLTASGTVGLSEASDLKGDFRYGDYVGRIALTGAPSDTVDFGIVLSAPLAAELSARFHDVSEAPVGELHVLLPTVPVDAPGLEALRSLAPLSADLRISGDSQRIRVDGQLTVQGQALQLDGTELVATAQQLTLAPLTIGLGSGNLRVEGEWPLATEQPDGRLQITAQGLAWPDVPVALAALNAELRGRNDQLDFSIDATLQPEVGPVPVQIVGRWSARELQLDTLSLVEAGLTGQLTYRQADQSLDSRFELKRLDLGRWLPEHPSRLDGTLSISGAPGAWRLDADGLTGEWRGLPLALDGDVVWSGEGLPSGTLTAQLDGNRLELRPIDGGHQATVQLGALGAVLPGAEAEGRVELTQRGDTLDWRVALERARLGTSEGPLQLGDLQARGQVRLQEQPAGELELRLASLTRGGSVYGPLQVSFSGDAERHRLTLDAETPQGRATLSASGGQQADGWSGAIEQLSLAPTGLPAPPLQLAAAMPLSLIDGRLALQRGCLARELARLCVEAALSTADTAAGAVSVSLTGLDLGLVPRAADANWAMQGALDGTAQLTLAGPTVTALEAELSAPTVLLTLALEEGDKRFALDALRLSARGPLQSIGARLEATLQGAGPMSLTVEGLGGEALSGQIEVDFASLGVLDGLSPEVIAPDGRLSGRLTLAGTTEALDIGGALALSALKAELPGAGLKIVEGELALSFPEAGVAALAGTIGTGEGLLQIEAEARRGADGKPELTARLDGERVLVADLPNVRLLASPAVRIQTSEGVLVASGTLGLPEGRIDLERFEPGVSVSADVVVLDRPVSAPAPVRTDIRYTLGPALKLKGFGLDAGLTGGLRVRSRPGRPVTASGTLDLIGRYRAYGQNLTIDRGRLLWANAPIGNPGFDFSAYRTIDQLKAGVRVRGSANAPELTVYTDPPREASDALSWLVLGRPLSSASGNDGQQLSAAAGALGSVGGALIGATVGQRLGVEINIESSAELGGSPAFTVGKMLSPKLFVGFGRSLFDSAQLVIVRYRLTEHYELEALSGRETKIGANYRLER